MPMPHGAHGQRLPQRKLQKTLTAMVCLMSGSLPMLSTPLIPTMARPLVQMAIQISKTTSTRLLPTSLPHKTWVVKLREAQSARVRIQWHPHLTSPPRQPTATGHSPTDAASPYQPPRVIPQAKVVESRALNIPTMSHTQFICPRALP